MSEDLIAYMIAFLSAARSDVADANPADVGMSGIPVLEWRKAYLEGCLDMANGLVSRMPAGQREVAVETIRTALEAKP